jgi:hypothetical protein
MNCERQFIMLSRTSNSNIETCLSSATETWSRKFVIRRDFELTNRVEMSHEINWCFRRQKMTIMRIERWIRSSMLKDTIEAFHQQFRIERTNCWKFAINHQFSNHFQRKHLTHLHSHHLRFRSHFLIHQSRHLVSMTFNQIVNTNSQNTHSRSTRMKIFARWIKFDRHLSQIIKHSNHTSHHHQKSLMRKSYQCWISFTKRRRNSKTQKITSILNWRSILISADMLIC